jgi:HSP20 family protein
MWTTRTPLFPMPRSARFDRDFNDFVESLFNDAAPLGRSVATPGHTETDDAFVFEFDLPGFRREDLEISARERLLTLKGTRPEASVEGARPRRRECWSGTFTRSYTLPEGADPARIAATLRDGVLTLTFGKAQPSAERTIFVE